VGPFVPGEVNDIALDGENVWLGTVGGVWRLIRETGQWHLYGEEDGLIGRWVWAVALEADARAVWFGTAEGLTRFDYRLRRKAP
jgi:ligand-binding sensor domain-containing protein